MDKLTLSPGIGLCPVICIPRPMLPCSLSLALSVNFQSLPYLTVLSVRMLDSLKLSIDPCLYLIVLNCCLSYS